MQSKLADESRRLLVAESQKLSPEQRLDAFLVHCRLMAEIHAAGRKLRAQQTTPPP
jgi:hypothetical protein